MRKEVEADVIIKWTCPKCGSKNEQWEIGEELTECDNCEQEVELVT